MTSSAALTLDGVTKHFGSAVAVDGLRLEVAPGSMLGLLGPSGCGKTTVLRMVAGLVPVTAGTITVDGEDITGRPPHRRDIGLVFQHYALFPHLSVVDNVGFGLEMRGVPASEIRSRVAEALAMVQLSGLDTRRPRELSGGQQQRVALARALVIRPRILLLDEPLSNLDARLRDELRLEIREIQQRLAITTVFVTHDQAEALAMCDVVGVMAQGRLAQIGPPVEVYERPASLAVAEFVGRLNTWPCEVVAPGRIRLDGRELAATTDGLASGTALATIRPHRLLLGGLAPDGATSHVTGQVTHVAYVGDLVQYHVAAGALQLKVEAHAARHAETHRVGDVVACRWWPDDLRVFGA
ncbi:MAG: ABC transporter ATP-binding protein [Acidobacteria bacterium]|nr:ABC transporter ATP-binding protein [Acidobacteriota bacterium]